MTSKLRIALFAVALGTELVVAQEKPAAPEGAPPRFVVVRSVDQAKQEAVFDVQVVTEHVLDKPVLLVYPDGYKRMTLGTKPSYVRPAEGFRVSLRQAKWSGVDGKEIGAEVAAKKLAPGVMVLLSADGAAVDAAYLRMFKEDNLVLIMPPDELPLPYLPHIGGSIPVKNVGQARRAVGGVQVSRNESAEPDN